MATTYEKKYYYNEFKLCKETKIYTLTIIYNKTLYQWLVGKPRTKQVFVSNSKGWVWENSGEKPNKYKMKEICSVAKLLKYTIPIESITY